MDINKKIKELEKELKKLKEDANKEQLIDRKDKVKGKDVKMKVTIKDETNDEVIFDDYIIGGIVSLISEKEQDKTFASAFTDCSGMEIMHLIKGAEKICDELSSRTIKNMAGDLLEGFKRIFEGDDDNE